MTTRLSGWDVVDENELPVAWFIERSDAESWLFSFINSDSMNIKPTERTITEKERKE